MNIISTLCEELKITEERCLAVIELLDGGNTIPFIARYRKEKTGAMDDVTLRSFADRLEYLRGLEKRREEVKTAIEEQGKMTEEIALALENASILAEIEDIYRPFRPKRKTRASVAREKGLEPLAQIIFEQGKGDAAEVLAEAYINEEKGVLTAEDAIAGALDIIAEDISDNAEFRGELRRMMTREGKFVTCAVEGADVGVYSMYENFSQEIHAIPSHRILAANRGEKEEVLKVTLEMGDYIPLSFLQNRLVDPTSTYAALMEKAVEDSYRRLIFPSLEREIRTALTDDAGEKALVLFSENLKNLLLCPPIKGKTVLGYDPGYRTGCKLAVVDPTGRVLDTGVIYPTKPLERTEEAEKKVLSLVRKWGVDTVAIGNGTASKESEIFIAGVIKRNNLAVKYTMVSESGASVYSASPLGAEEFPDFDVTLRSAVSIARRLQDPLAELVKIEPRSIGVGQYQHDLKPARLSEALGGVVENCVNRVGVDLNTASYMLLSYVAGIGKTAAKNIVAYREENGAFDSRSQVKKVPKIGAKAFEQCAGFLRVPGGKEPLDNTGVHPESYDAAKALLKKFGHDPKKLTSDGFAGLGEKCDELGRDALAAELGIGKITLDDIIRELEKPGRDMRDDFAQPILRDDVLGMEDLKEGQVYHGVVRNVCDFGAFVDIGVHQDGLVHISQLSDRFVKHPSQVVSVGDAVKVAVLGVDLKRKKISLTMKGIKE
ncbi:MAG: RNA-binding transcriptional accessory protein [Ruminococcaceae bacterium]|nr:RNA-binding transcriptional accessory protein [Oscillospiraceae bacterium]